MLKLIKCIVIYIICSTLFTSSANSTENKILFKINNKIITSLDILNELNYLKIINKEFKKTNNKQAFEISKNSLIREKIKEIEITRIIKELKIDDNTLNNVILDYFKELQIKSISEFESFFLNKKIDPNYIKKKITIELLWNQLIFSRFNQNIKIDEEIERKILSNKDKQKEFLISEILFNISENEELNKKFELIEKSIDNTNFSQTALAYSDSNTANKGGLVGWIKETALNKKISNQLKKLKINEYTKPMITPGGFLILKVKDVRNATQDFNLDDEVKKVIKEKSNQQLNQFSNIYFNKLKKDIKINEL
ncbi:peptidylprolyl isomerase [Candidatus Pelagibacter sp.]|nr:peptidylprolyl isomerase [Candidatus Pelagibacter sp.]